MQTERNMQAVLMILIILLLQVSVGNIGNVLKELSKLPNPDDGKRKGSPKKEKEKEPDTRKDSPKKKSDEVSFSNVLSFQCKFALFIILFELLAINFALAISLFYRFLCFDFSVALFRSTLCHFQHIYCSNFIITVQLKY